MGSNVLLTGGTGYIGGTVLDTLATTHPEYNLTVLLRTVPNGFQERYPGVKIVRGGYDNFDIIANAVSQSNVVVHSGDSDHEGSIKAIIAGLLRRSSKSFLIHLSGTGIISDWRDPTYMGRLNPKVWSDVSDIDAITSLPDSALHRNVDKIIQSAAVAHGDILKTAIVCPPDIYGTGRGLVRTRSVYMPVFLEESVKLGATFYAGDGTNTRSWVHIEDLMIIYLKLVEAALTGGGNADWGLQGYYFAATHEASQLDIAKAAGSILHKHGILKTEDPQRVTSGQVNTMMERFNYPGIATYMFAANSRSTAERAKKLFEYEAKASTLWENIETDLLAGASR
ncbi:NAD(P)-binding protein [Mytilinidion resinicola]|uniref:NAD(P)-binding protein n=1 Tax=Mytilinidion resinicola TaxID=574789 RepID=A0A6A6Z462_9PEZI|nr:NAD(P)-binding protein [Mytilinidion resinicola]KAF2815820.1 NAD(P)-binding protein [Mytilinidion resinicola]